MAPTKMTPEDQAFNISFVGEVKKHPCLFDSNSTEYKQAQIQDKAWNVLSASVGESVEMCKKRWRNLRCCMTRYLKSVRDNVDSSANLRRKPYYLYNHMQFVVPYLKMKDSDSTHYESEDSIWIKNNESGEMMKAEDIAEEVQEEDEEEHEIESIDVQEEDHQQIKQSIIQSIKILPMNQENQSQETTTTYEIIEATPAKQPRIEAIHQVRELQLLMKVLCIVIMVLLNACVWRFFVKALHTNGGTLVASLVSAASNYTVSALLGWLIFGEQTSIIWWIGTTLVMAGLLLIMTDDESNRDKSDKKLH